VNELAQGEREKEKEKEIKRERSYFIPGI